MLSPVIFLNLIIREKLIPIAILNEITDWFLSCLQQDPASSSASYLHRLYSLQHLKYSKFYFKFSFCVHYHLWEKAFFFMYFFSFVLSQISLNIQFNVQLVPSFIIWAAMNKVFIHHSDPYFSIHQFIENSSKNFSTKPGNQSTE